MDQLILSRPINVRSLLDSPGDALIGGRFGWVPGLQREGRCAEIGLQMMQHLHETGNGRRRGVGHAARVV